MLAHIVSLMRNIVVAGSHGKTTTTSLVSNILYAAKLDDVYRQTKNCPEEYLDPKTFFDRTFRTKSFEKILDDVEKEKTNFQKSLEYRMSFSKRF